MSREQRYLIYEIEDGRLQVWGLYDTYEAAAARIARSGLSASKIAAVDYFPPEKVKKR